MSADIQFNMRLEQDDYEKIEKIRKRIGLSSKKQAVVYLINYYMDREKFTDDIAEALLKRMKKVYPPDCALQESADFSASFRLIPNEQYEEIISTISSTIDSMKEELESFGTEYMGF